MYRRSFVYSEIVGGEKEGAIVQSGPVNRSSSLDHRSVSPRGRCIAPPSQNKFHAASKRRRFVQRKENFLMRTMSRTAILVVAVLFGAMALAGPAAAQGHALITSAGQSPGALMLQVLARQANVEHVYDATAEVAMLEDA